MGAVDQQYLIPIAARVIGATGSTTPPNGYIVSNDIVSVTRTSTGNYHVLLARNANLQETIFQAVPVSGPAGASILWSFSDAVLPAFLKVSVSTFKGGAAEDIDFYILLGRVRVQNRSEFNTMLAGGGAVVSAPADRTGFADIRGNVSIPDQPTGGWPSAASTVDIASYFPVSQTTAAQTLVLPAPTDTTPQIAVVNNVGSASFTMLGQTIAAGNGILCAWTGSAWNAIAVVGSGGGGGTGWLLGGNTIGASSHIFGALDNTFVEFRSNNLARGRLLANGNWAFGVTASAYPFRFSGSPVDGTATWHLDCPSSNGTVGMEINAGGGADGTGTGATILNFTRVFDGTQVGSVTKTAAAGVTYNVASDRRRKTKIRSTSRGLETLKKIKVRDFAFREQPEKDDIQGFIAQELAPVYPDAVSRGGPNAKKRPWCVDYGRVTPLLVQALQDLSALVEEQKKELRRQKKEIIDLQKRLRT